MKRLAFFVFLLSVLSLFCSGISAQTPRTSVESKTIKLDKAAFLKRVVNFEKSPNVWNYLGDKPAVIDFYADWCGPCRRLAPVLDELAAEYAGGKALVFTLTVDDYHRYCYPVDGEKSEQTTINGVLHTVRPIGNEYFPVYKENTREYCRLSTKEFSDLIFMEVGALMIGRIVNHHGAGRVCRGDEKGYFQFGGSTIVILTKKNAIQIDDDIMENSRNGFRTVVKMGEKIGVSKKK